MSTTEATQRTYRKIENTTTFRVLHLYAGEDGAELFGKVNHVDLRNKPKFDALSYVWGDATMSHRLYDPDGNFYPITKNLWLALSDLRRRPSEHSERSKQLGHYIRRDRPDGTMLVIFADGICINQRDNNEKTQQVSLMGRIYGQASRVISYIGPATPDTANVIRISKQLLSHALKHLNIPFERRPAIDWDDILAKAEVQPMTESQRETFWDLLLRPWSTRLWIVQECLLSRKIEMFCGHVPVEPWSLFPELAAAFYVMDPFDSKFFVGPTKTLPAAGIGRALISLSLLQGLRENRTFSYPVLLRLCNIFRSSDPRDQIYATLSLAPKSLSMTPDYNKTAREVYIEATIAAIESSKSLDVLCGIENERVLDLPSWVPDCSSEPLMVTETLSSVRSAFQDHHASKATLLSKLLMHLKKLISAKEANSSVREEGKALYSIHSNAQVLTVRGIVVDSIKIQPTLIRSEWGLTVNDSIVKRTPATFSWLLRMLKCEGYEGQYPTGCSYIEAMVSTLWMEKETFPTELLHNAVHPILVGWVTFILEVLSHYPAANISDNFICDIELPEDINPPVINLPGMGPNVSQEEIQEVCQAVAMRYVFFVMKIAQAWSFCESESGYLGYVTNRAGAGDLIAVIRGAPGQFILRKMEGGYQLVGEAYIYGIKDIETMKSEGRREIDIHLI
ncbi:hypothetical protein ACEPPN_017939 [Leptodophora sp. 'Broadleaf-Isolate-01']